MNVPHLCAKDPQHAEILVDVAEVLQETVRFDHELGVDIVDQQMPDQVLRFGLVCFHRLLQRLLNVHVEERVRNFLANQQLGCVTPCFVHALLEIKQITVELSQFLLQGHGCLGAGGGNSHDRSHDGLGGVTFYRCLREEGGLGCFIANGERGDSIFF